MTVRSKIAVLRAPGAFELQERDVAPSRDEVLVRIEACGLCNWELNHWKGIIGSCPQSLGHEWGGEIVDVGAGVSRFKVGDRVTGLADALAGFAEYGTFRESRCAAVAPSVGSGLLLGEPLKCVVTVLRAAAPEVGDVGVVNGCGPMGLWCIQALSGAPLMQLAAVDIDPKKLALAKRFGATVLINPLEQDPREALASACGGRQADFVIEGTGIPGQLEKAGALLRCGRGRLVLMSSHEAPAETFDFRPLIGKSADIRIAHPSYSLDEMDDLRRAVDMLNKGVFSLEETVSHRFPLERIQEAFETLEHKPKGYLKGIVTP